MEIPSELQSVLVSTPDTLHGQIRFANTRVPARQLFDYIFSGETVETFLEDFEGVSKSQVDAVLHYELKRVHSWLKAA